MSGDPSPGERLSRSWNENARAWTDAVRQRSIESRRVATDRAILHAIAALSPARVLDVGCGEGWLCRGLDEGGIHCIGVDGSADLIAAAREVDAHGDYHMLRYEEFDRLPEIVKAGSLDVAVCNFSLLHEEVRSTLEALRAVLRPGGTLLIQTLHPCSSGCAEYVDGWRTENFACSEQRFPEPMPWFFRTVASWIRLVRESGFELGALTEVVHPETARPLSLLLAGVRADAARPG